MPHWPPSLWLSGRIGRVALALQRPRLAERPSPPGTAHQTEREMLSVTQSEVTRFALPCALRARSSARGVNRRLDHAARAPVHHLGPRARDIRRGKGFCYEGAQLLGRRIG